MVTNSPNLESTMSSQVVTSSDRNLVHEHELPGERRILIGRSYVAWGAVIAGALTAMAILLLASAFAYACGIPAYRGGAFGFGAALYSILSSMIAFFIGGCLVSYLAPHSEQRSGLVHGMLAWVLGVLLISFLATTAAGLFHGMVEVDAFRTAVNSSTEFTHAQMVGAAWSTFIGLFLGLISACLGGLVGYSGKLNQVENIVKH